ncbi:MAG: SDR family NAD(P)-dependent oxidoreductase [Deltaproteobacteria bacterium]|jgi:NAD(P)-dependent dehydrogenase (short-subunit alcohol dehydrogenase family)
MRLQNKVAIITGGGRGIGRAISSAFASEGASVVMAARTRSRLEETAEAIRAQGGDAKAIQTDITDEGQIERMVGETIQVYGRIDILVNNSGIAGPTARVVDLDLAAWNEVFAVDVTGAMLCAKHVLKHMIPQKSGVIINIVSEGGRSGDGRSGYPMRSPYCCSKAGLIALTETLSIEVGEYNIRVNAISPAAVRGERIINVVKGRSEATGLPFEEVMSTLVENYSLKRPAEESEIATAAVFLASDESSAITGQTLVTNCGQHIIF